MVRAHFDFIWRSLRRQGLPSDAADDAAQQVFVIASRRLSDIEIGAERSFLCQTATRVGSDARRAFGRKKERVGVERALTDVQDVAPGPEDQLQRQRALEILDEILE